MSAGVGGVILLLIVVNALYVAAEFAAVSARHGQVRVLAQQGNSVARRLLATLETPAALDRYIAACQIGITLSSIVLGVFGQATVALDLGATLHATTALTPLAAAAAAAAIVLVALTSAQVVFGELVPKSLALQFPVRVALLTYLPTHLSVGLFRPFLAVLNGSAGFVLRRLGLTAEVSHRHLHSPDEIAMLIAESRDGGLLEADEQQRLSRALQLSRRTARQLMVPRRKIEGVAATAPPEAVVELAATSPYTRLPVYHGTIDDIVGMLHTKDVAAHVAAHGAPASAAALLRPVARVAGDLTADRLLAFFRAERARLALVVDEFGGVEGLVTLEDVLAELVGDVADEFKDQAPAAERLPDGRVRLPGALRPDEALPYTGVLWDDDEAATVGGHVMAHLGAVPRGGERLTIGGAEVEVERVEDGAVVSLLVTPAPGPSEADPT